MLNDDFLVESQDFIVFPIKIFKTIHIAKLKGFTQTIKKSGFFYFITLAKL